MKKYLFGLGAMIVGAGLMFVLMHGEVSADRVRRGIIVKLFHLNNLGMLSSIVKLKT